MVLGKFSNPSKYQFSQLFEFKEAAWRADQQRKFLSPDSFPEDKDWRNWVRLPAPWARIFSLPSNSSQKMAAQEDGNGRMGVGSPQRERNTDLSGPGQR